jgi:hypothetical protein
LHLDNSDINDIATAVAAAFSSDEELLRVVDDSSDDEEQLAATMIIKHIWVGFNIKYMWVLLHSISSIMALTISTNTRSIRADGRTYRMTAEQLQERFAGTRQTLWGYWHAKKGSRIHSNKIRRHLKKMGVSGFYREMLWHLLSPEEFRQLTLLRNQGTLHTWKW